ncbi:MAG: alcohol dehydrogenase catalytic domain-containing protein [Myxococcota bacterium]|nr:alcohol dehydrogenase catalytic domain-containing protein [Myxococcota bacterium]
MSGTMKAVVKAEPGVGASLRDVPIPRPGPGEVLVKVRATSICGTDVHIYTWDRWSQGRIGAARLPQVLGHEVAGEVVEVAAGVRAVKPGDYVSAETHIPCGRCLPCRTGDQHICANLSILGVDRDGAFAEYIAIPESVCWVNDRTIPPEIATIQEPLGNAAYTVLGNDGDVAGKTMAIVGEGPIALFAVAVARACGVTPIFLVGKNEFNLALARRMGADHVLHVARDADRVAYVRERTDGVGVDLALEMVGSPEAIADALRMVRKGGRLSAFGLASAGDLPINYIDGMVLGGIEVHGINGRRMFDTWYRVRNLLVSGRLDVSPVITGLLPLEQYARGFDLAMKRPRQSAKIVLFPSDDELRAARERRPSCTAA